MLTVVASEYLVITPMSGVTRKRIRWLWKGRLAVGKITLLSGDPGAGKSWLSLAMAATIAHGAPFPGETERRPPARVLLMSAEDDPADTIGPRLDALNADDSRIEVIEAVARNNGDEADDSQRPIWLTRDLTAIEDALKGRLYRFLIIDPLNAYIPAELDTNKDNAVRSVLAPLSAMASRYEVSILCLRHLTKGARDKAIYRGQGSIGFTAAARIELMAGQDPNDATGARRFLIPVKCNVHQLEAAIAYEIRDGRFTWGGESQMRADTMLAPETGSDERTALDEAIEVLRELLSDGALPANEVAAQAKKAGVSYAGLKRAKRVLEVKSQRRGYARESAWYWYLPKTTESAQQTLPQAVDAQVAQESHSGKHEHLEPLQGSNGHEAQGNGREDDGAWFSIFGSGPPDDPGEDDDDG